MKKALQFLKDHATIILALTTAYIYCCVCFYEMNYLKTFGVPTDYMSIDINTLLTDAVAILSPLFLFTFIPSILAIGGIYFWNKNPKVGRLMLFSGIILFAFLYTTYVFSPLPGRILIFTFGGAELIAIILAFSIRVKSKTWQIINSSGEPNNEVRLQKKESGNLDKYDQTQTESDKNLANWEKVILNHPLRAALAATLISLLIIPPYFGVIDAKRKYKFMEVVDTTSHYVVVRKYGDEIICVNYDTCRRIIGQKIKLIKLDGKTQVALESKILGRMADTEYQLERYKASSSTKSKPGNKELPQTVKPNK
jgi:hypothetical protein